MATTPDADWNRTFFHGHRGSPPAQELGRLGRRPARSAAGMRDACTNNASKLAEGDSFFVVFASAGAPTRQ